MRKFLSKTVMLLALLPCCVAPLKAADDTPAPTGPYVTPSVDVSVRYELVAPDGRGVVHQTMRWQAASLRQRIDLDTASVYMITSWRDHTLTVVDTLGQRRSVMPAPGRELTPPGRIPDGTFSRLDTAMVAGQFCTNWRTTDDSGHQSDACYTPDGILLQVMQKGQITARALSVTREVQPDSVFAVPQDYRPVAPAR